MKTAEELFTKYEILAPSEENPDVFDQHTDCVDYNGFINGIKERTQEIISLIDEMIKRNQDKMDDDRPASILDMARWQEQIDCLTELKQKILKESEQ